ncbi:MAG: DNA polymerase I [Bdellovibrionota bacterium]|nr:DNA polymerase I [Bdellovibrionota bacterium]
MDKIYIVDTSSFIFRAFYAITNLTTKSGFPTNALYGFLKMYLKLLKEANPKYIVSVFDTGKKNFRHDLYSEYKANRAKCPDELALQMPFFRDFVKALGVKVIDKEGFEADDVIATITDKAKEFQMGVEIVTADKDLMQLVESNVGIWDTMKDKHYDREAVKEKFGVYPENVLNYLALVGDASDNVPGVKGLGPKTAVTLLENYDSIEALYENLEEIANNKNIRGAKSLADNLKNNKEILFLSKKLVELEHKVDITLNDKSIITISPNDFKLFFEKQNIIESELSSLVSKFEFESLFKSFLENYKDIVYHDEQKNEDDTNHDSYEVKIVYKEDFKDFIEKLKNQNLFAFDTETTSLNIFEAELVGVSFCFDTKTSYYVPLLHEVMFEENKQVDINEFISLVKKIFENENQKKTGHNLKYDIQIFKNYGVNVKGVSFDTMIAAYLLSPDDLSFSLSSTAKKYLGLDGIEYKDVIGKKDNFSQVDIQYAANYSAEDSYFSWMLYLKLSKELEEKELTKVFYDIDLPLLDVLSKMELNGVCIDTESLKKSSIFLGEELKTLENEIYELAGGSTFNINSPKQLSFILFEKLRISTKGIKKTTQGYSTDVTTLEKLKGVHPIADKLLQYRSVFKLKSTYIDSLPLYVSKKTGRLHTKFNQAVTGTGRLSSSDPNLQNIPVKTEEGRKIRDAFIAPKGKVVISADYSQVELRVLAHMSHDKALIDAFKNNEDIHTKTSKFIFNLGEDEIPTSEQRRLGKVINFGVVYGMSAFRLSKELSINMFTAQKYIDGFFQKYSGVKAYFDKLLVEVKEKGYVSTMFGRKRFTASIDKEGRDKGYLNRMAINAPIQGTAADIIKLSMLNIQREIEKNNYPLKMIIQIHDELVFECDESFKEKGAEFIKFQMENVLKLEVPLKVDVGVGASWGEAH